MSILNQIAYFKKRRDEVPSQELTKRLAETKNNKGVQEIAENLWNSNKNVQSDCLKVLYEIGCLDPELIADYVDYFLKLLNLNSERIRIRGVNLHEELMPYGRMINETDRLKDMITIKKLGFNTVRAAHYPHDEKLTEVADEIGLMIPEEIPVYWYCDFANSSVRRLSARMIRDLICRDFNHPSVVLWSIGMRYRSRIGFVGDSCVNCCALRRNQIPPA